MVCWIVNLGLRHTVSVVVKIIVFFRLLLVNPFLLDLLTVQVCSKLLVQRLHQSEQAFHETSCNIMWELILK